VSFTYNNLVPATNNDPSVDQPQMLINTQSINSIIAVDHIGFNAGNGGYHTVIHQKTQVSDPAPIASFNQVYSKNYTPNTTGGIADTQLFAITGIGGISQLTGYSTQNSTDGWQWVGGILIQWGTVTTASSGSFSSGLASGSVTFKDRVSGAIPFPTNCFTVIATPFWQTASGAPSTDISAGGVSINQNTLSTTKFDWQFNSQSGRFRGFQWFAIGN
jgi:hypothetical protein